MNTAAAAFVDDIVAVNIAIDEQSSTQCMMVDAMVRYDWVRTPSIASLSLGSMKRNRQYYY